MGIGILIFRTADNLPSDAQFRTLQLPSEGLNNGMSKSLVKSVYESVVVADSSSNAAGAVTAVANQTKPVKQTLAVNRLRINKLFTVDLFPELTGSTGLATQPQIQLEVTSNVEDNPNKRNKKRGSTRIRMGKNTQTPPRSQSLFLWPKR